MFSIKEPVDNISSTSHSSSNDEIKAPQTKTYIVCTNNGNEYIPQSIPNGLESRVVDEEKGRRNNSLSELEQEHLYNQVRDYTKSDKNESELFCSSLVGTLERLGQRKRQLAKIKIQQILYELEFSDSENMSN